MRVHNACACVCNALDWTNRMRTSRAIPYEARAEKPLEQAENAGFGTMLGLGRKAPALRERSNMSIMDRIKAMQRSVNGEKPRPPRQLTWREKCRKGVTDGKAALARMGSTTNLDMARQAEVHAARIERADAVRHESYERWLRGVEYRNAANSERRKQAEVELARYESRATSNSFEDRLAFIKEALES